jgi:hypothetical protein
MILTYCDECGILMRAEHSSHVRDICEACVNGTSRKERMSRDSGHIPFATRPSSAAILREIRATVLRRA